MPKILAVASGGGHWTQLLRLRPAFEGCSVHYVTTLKGARESLSNEKISIVKDGARESKIALVLLMAQLARIIALYRPDVVITTGAAPGVIALRIARVFGAKTVWIDSIANSEELSLSGRLALGHADLTLTQWPHLVAKYPGVVYWGEVV